VGVGAEGCLQAGDEDVEAGGEPLVAVVGPGVAPRADSAGKRLAGSERRKACSSALVAVSWTRCSPGEVRSLREKPRM
jgi:hypothetical protein